MEEQKVNNIKICRICGINECKQKQRRCVKCISNRDNQLMREKQYFKTYYETHKEDIINNSKENYRKKHQEARKRGRPPKTKTI